MNIEQLKQMEQDIANEGQELPVGTYEGKAMNYLGVIEGKAGRKILLNFVATGDSWKGYEKVSKFQEFQGSYEFQGRAVERAPSAAALFLRLGLTAEEVAMILEAATNVEITEKSATLIGGSAGGDPRNLLNPTTGEPIALNKTNVTLVVSERTYEGKTYRDLKIKKAASK